MTTEFVLAYVGRKMKEIGVCDDYLLAFREMVVPGMSTLEVKADGQYYFFVGTDAPTGMVVAFGSVFRIESEMGVYDLSDILLNEMQYEHTGKITLTNSGRSSVFLKFIVAVPNKKLKK